MMLWLLGPVGAIAMIAGGYAWKSQSSIVRLETENEQMAQTIIELTKALNETNTDLGSVQTWVEENYVSSKVFNASKGIQNREDD